MSTWIVSALVRSHPSQDLPPRHQLGTVKAADHETARWLARVEFGDQLGLHVQNVLSAQIADEERAAVVARRIPPQGYHKDRHP